MPEVKSIGGNSVTVSETGAGNIAIRKHLRRPVEVEVGEKITGHTIILSRAEAKRLRKILKEV